MTLLAVWRESALERLWVVSDSRLSCTGSVGGVVRLTDRGAKVLEAQLILEGTSPQAPPLATRSLGFAYAGSSLVALQTYAAVLPLWRRLISPTVQHLPSMEACAANLGAFLRAYVHEVTAAGDRRCHTECVLIGHDESAGRVEAWRLAAFPEGDGVGLAMEHLDLAPGRLVAIGSGREEFLSALEPARPAGGSWRREPLEVIRAHLADDRATTVGGGVQIGMATPEGFGLHSDARPFRVGEGRVGDRVVDLRYRGFDLGDVAHVGHALAALPAVIG